ncbi:transcription elongation factor spt4 [Boeremia exigua]|uniref:transcription elongation factor spt4 n=1 Tax=Boeremia exigua TaxID=749465 RepID=UPI001E8CA031|nr:transcription elongation factor spt4 [Boeremia exigua]KAH6642787.1 transcription elongation factor spt4 [Boeremia exigua]
MPPKKGRATTKKVDKYKYVDSVGTEVSPPPPSSSSRYAGRSSPLSAKRTPVKQPRARNSPVVPRKADSRRQTNSSVPRKDSPVPLSAKSFLATDSPLASPARPSKRPPPKRPPRPSSTHLPSDPPIYHPPSPNMPSMIPGGAFVPPNQQRNLRACMVCSIVRTSSQFMSSGCPNCEEFLELTGSTENINDCTSQVFEGLITVADTSKSWVARYQRLEGYVSGVYATQVEGILPDEIISAVEAAGVNYVPRDGSEDQIVPKE